MPSGRSKSESRSAWRTVATAVGAFAAFVLVSYALLVLAVIIAFSNWHLEHHEREHLQPIPVDAASCAYVVNMHQAATEFQKLYSGLIDAYYANWTATQWRVAAAADVLNYSISASVEHLPPRVKWYLMAARDELRLGRTEVALAHNSVDLLVRTSGFWSDGQAAFGYAGDLIGNQCSVPLRADSPTN